MIRGLPAALALIAGLFLCAGRSEAGFELFVADRGNNTIVRIDATGGTATFATGLHDPRGLAFDASGNLYVANLATNTIRRFSPSGLDLGDFASTGLNGPGGLAFDTAGNLYVANLFGDTIHRFSPSGLDLGDFASTGLRSGPY